MKERKVKMIYIFLVGMIMIGGLLGVYLIGKEDVQYSFGSALAAVLC